MRHYDSNTCRISPVGPAQSRRGGIAVLALILMSVLIALTALAVELGLLMTRQNELQRAADAAAMAACWEFQARLNAGETAEAAQQAAREVARHTVRNNPAGHITLDIALNLANDPAGDIVFGVFEGFGNPFADLVPDNSHLANAIRVTVRRDPSANGAHSFLFGRLLGIHSQSHRAAATAALVKNVRGFTSPGEDALAVLPLALKLDDWLQMLESGPDDWTYDPETGDVIAGGDGLPEWVVFPQNTEAAGNSGTLSIGGDNSNAATLKRQISEGLTDEDLEHHGGSLDLGEEGSLGLYGQPGIMATLEKELKEISGEPRALALYTEVVDQGSNARFTIVQFVGVRVMNVDLKGSMENKRVVIQPSNIQVKNIIPGTHDQTYSDGLYSSVVLVR